MVFVDDFTDDYYRLRQQMLVTLEADDCEASPRLPYFGKIVLAPCVRCGNVWPVTTMYSDFEAQSMLRYDETLDDWCGWQLFYDCASDVLASGTWYACRHCYNL